MSPAASHAEVQRLRVVVTERLGLHYGEDGLGRLNEALDARMEALGCASAGAYLARLTAPASGRAELRELAARLSTPETYFLRSDGHFRAVAEVVVPALAKARGARPRLRALSAGCASGEELYSLAMTVREAAPDLAGWELSLTGVDMNHDAIRKAAAGRYTAWSLRGVGEAVRARYFTAERDGYRLDASIRAMATFHERNLLDDDPLFWRPDVFDVVFCRNVTMYLAPAAARAVFERIARSLAPGGWLFLGHAEALPAPSPGFELQHTHGTFYYRRATSPRVPSDDEPAPDLGGSWVDAIARASERITTLAQRPAPPGSGGAAATAVSPVDLTDALALLRQERFAEALDALRGLPPEGRDAPEALAVRAVLLTQRGELAEAERTCHLLLGRDPSHVGAHHLLALCREAAGDARGAAEWDRAAIRLDPGFAMAHLHLGLLARRRGEEADARVALGQAFALLGREDASRILLYGGGFSRDALARLCRVGPAGREGA